MNDRIYYSKQAEERAQRQFLMTTAVFAIMAMAVGAVITILVTPRRGDEVRHELGVQANEAFERGRGVVGTLAHDAQRTFEKAQAEVEDRVANVRTN